MWDVESTILVHIKMASVIKLLSRTLDYGSRLFSCVPAVTASGFQALTALEDCCLSCGWWTSVWGLKTVPAALLIHGILIWNSKKKVTTFSPFWLEKIDPTDNSFEIRQMWICFPQTQSLKPCVHGPSSCTCARPLWCGWPVIPWKQPLTPEPVRCPGGCSSTMVGVTGLMLLQCCWTMLLELK